MSQSSSSPAQSPQSSAAHPSVDQLGEVQAILAERTSSTLGCNEVLVAYQPSWIPITNVLDGPMLTKHRNAVKCRFQSAVGEIFLPVEPDSTLADDIAAADAGTGKHRAGVVHIGSPGSAKRGTPRMSCDCVAKRAAPSTMLGSPKK